MIINHGKQILAERRAEKAMWRRECVEGGEWGMVVFLTLWGFALVVVAVVGMHFNYLACLQGICG